MDNTFDSWYLKRVNKSTRDSTELKYFVFFV